MFGFQVWMIDECLTRNLLTVDPEHGNKLEIHLDPRIPLLIREADCLAKMAIPTPVVTNVIFAKKTYFILVKDSLQVCFRLFPLCIPS